MNDPEKIDFTALDPARQHTLWEQRITRVTRLALARQRELRSVPQQLITWARPALAMAAALALLIWSSFLFHDPNPQAKSTDPAYLLSHWALSDEVPSPTEVLTVLGGEHDSR